MHIRDANRSRQSMFATWGRIWQMHFHLLFPSSSLLCSSKSIWSDHSLNCGITITCMLYIKCTGNPAICCRALLPCSEICSLLLHFAPNIDLQWSHLPAITLLLCSARQPLWSFEPSPILYWCIYIVYIHHQCYSAYLFQHFWVLCFCLCYGFYVWQ